MVDIRPSQLPSAITPLRETDSLIVDQGVDGVRKTTPSAMTDSVAPVASQTEAQVGTDNTKRMTPLRTKESIASEVGVSLASNAQGAKADSAVQSVNGHTGNSVTLDKSDVGLGNVSNTAPADMPISTATQTALNLKADASITVSAGAGLTGGGNLSANRSFALNAASIDSLAKADSSVQTVNGVPATGGNVDVSAEDIRLQDTRSSAIIEIIPLSVNFIQTSGYYSSGDGGGAMYRRVPSEPSHTGKFQSADGAWWEISENSVCPNMFGAYGDGVNDDTIAFKNALTYGNNVIYLNSGNYILTDSINVLNGIITGNGVHSRITSRCDDKLKPILAIGGRTVISNLIIGYDESFITGSEVFHERSVIQTWCQNGSFKDPVQRGGGVHNVTISNCGTAIVDDADAGPFSASFKDIQIIGFTYGGVWLICNTRTGNVYSNIYITNDVAEPMKSKTNNAESAIFFEGEESESTMQQLNIEWARLKRPVFIHGVNGGHCSSIHFEQVEITQPYTGMFINDRSSMEVENLTVFYCKMSQPGTCIVELINGGYLNTTGTLQEGYLQISTLHCKGLNDGSGTLPGERGLQLVTDFSFVYRSQDRTGNYRFRMDNYVYYSFQSADQSIYSSFPNDPHSKIIPISGNSKKYGFVPEPISGTGRVDTFPLAARWGRVLVPANSTRVVSFKPFIGPCIHASAQVWEVATTAASGLRVSAVPTSSQSITLVNTFSYEVSVYWMAWGIN